MRNGSIKEVRRCTMGAISFSRVAHTAGSIKRMMPPPVFERGIVVTHAAGVIAPAVAELNILLILLSLRQVHRVDRMLKDGESWAAAKASA